MTAMDTLSFLAGQIADPGAQWSLGTFGAIAEFMRDADEPAALSQSDTAISVTTERGALCLAPPAGTRLFAFETATKSSWSNRVALCLPESDCPTSRRDVLTEVGPDAEAVREQDRHAILFDLGLGALHADLHVRVSDPAVVVRLRACASRSVLDPTNPAMSIILETQPHRVFASRVGRIEVYQPIPPADGRSPEGPHTHVLPSLLRHQRTHAATEPIPSGWVPCAHLYPAHPAMDGMGNGRPFSPQRHDAFQAMLRAYGDPLMLDLKERVIAAVAAGAMPTAFKAGEGRFARGGVRVALRQLKAAHREEGALVEWLAVYERVHDETADADHTHR